MLTVQVCELGLRAVCILVLSHFSHVRLCDHMDHSPPGSSVHGILQARILEWVAVPLLQGIFLSQGSNSYLFLHWQASSLPPVPRSCLPQGSFLDFPLSPRNAKAEASQPPWALLSSSLSFCYLGTFSCDTEPSSGAPCSRCSRGLHNDGNTVCLPFNRLLGLTI